MTTTPTRRQLLATLGATGTVTVGAGLGLASSTAPYNRFTYAQSTAGGLRVAWYATYNGRFLGAPRAGENETTVSNASTVLSPTSGPGYVDDVTGPVVDLGNLLPGDSGTLAVGVLPDSDPVGVWVRPRVLATAENGRVEPERTAGDADAEGDLGQFLSMRLWEDSGTLGSGVGACDGRFVGDPELTDGETTVTEVETDLVDGVRVADCLDTGDRRCLGLAWRFVTGDDVDVTQTDSLAFVIEVVPTGCGGACNPFTGEGCDE
jgi:hypothetical protein